MCSSTLQIEGKRGKWMAVVDCLPASPNLSSPVQCSVLEPLEVASYTRELGEPSNAAAMHIEGGLTPL
jgi:hypothetical protein